MHGANRRSGNIPNRQFTRALLLQG